MTPGQYWARLVKATPKLKQEEAKITLTVKELRRIVEKAVRDNRPKSKRPIDSLFDGIFGE